jgi:hypothetical protein
MRKPGIISCILLIPVLFAGCSDQGPSSSGALTQALAQDMAEVVVEDQEAILDGSFVDPATGVAISSPVNSALSSPPPCTPAPTPNPPSNGDGDAVPDSVQLDFAGCTFVRGNYSFVLSGLIHIIDPTAAQQGFGVKSVFDGFTSERTFVPTSRVVTAEFNGTRQITGTADAVNHLITNFETIVTRPGLGSVVHTKDWNATFTADVPGTIAHDQPVPSGTLNVAGSSEWSRGQNEVFSLSITTSGLHFDAGCTVAPRFDAGSSVLVITRRGESHTVVVEHTACGQYTVTRS